MTIENLKIINSSEMARELQKKSAEVQRRNKAMREEAKMHIRAMKELGDGAPSAEEALKGALVQAMADGDNEAIVRISTILMEYEKPKLSRADVTQTNIDLEELSDEEHEELKKEAGL